MTAHYLLPKFEHKAIINESYYFDIRARKILNIKFGNKENYMSALSLFILVLASKHCTAHKV